MSFFFLPFSHSTKSKVLVDQRDRFNVHSLLTPQLRHISNSLFKQSPHIWHIPIFDLINSPPIQPYFPFEGTTPSANYLGTDKPPTLHKFFAINYWSSSTQFDRFVTGFPSIYDSHSVHLRTAYPFTWYMYPLEGGQSASSSSTKFGLVFHHPLELQHQMLPLLKVYLTRTAPLVYLLIKRVLLN